MGLANDLLASFLKAYPQVDKGNLSLEEINNSMAKFQEKINNEPKDDFDGLSSIQISELLYTPLEPGHVLRLKDDIHLYIHESPLFVLSEMLLNAVNDAGQIRLTKTGNLPMAICEQLFNADLINWDFKNYVKRFIEDEIPYIFPIKQYLVDEGLLKKRNNTLSLTKKGEKFLKGEPLIRFISLFKFFTNRFHWGNFYDISDNGSIGNFAWAYSLYLLAKYGDQSRKSEFYCLKIIRAFETDLWNNLEDEDLEDIKDTYLNAYEYRFFNSFANWFGLINIKYEKVPETPYKNHYLVSKSELFDKLFHATILN